MFPETCVVPCTFLIQPCTHHIAFRVTIIDYCKLSSESSGQMSLSNHQQWVSISLTLHTSTINLIENTKQAYTIYTCRQHIGTAIDNTIRYQMLMMAWPTELNCWCVAVSISLSSWCSCQYLHMVNVLTTPHLQSEHHSPGIDQRSLDRKTTKKKPTATERHTYQENSRNRLWRIKSKLALLAFRISFSTVLHDLSLALRKLMLWTEPSRPELTPDTPWMCGTRTQSWSSATSAHASTTARRSFSTCSKAFPIRCTNSRTKAQVCNVCGSLWSKEMYQWIESLEIADVRLSGVTTWHMFAHLSSLNNDIFIFLCGQMVVQTFSQRTLWHSRNVSATGLKRNGRRRSIRCGHISEQSISSRSYANVWPSSTMIFTSSRKHPLSSTGTNPTDLYRSLQILHALSWELTEDAGGSVAGIGGLCDELVYHCWSLTSMPHNQRIMVPAAKMSLGSTWFKSRPRIVMFRINDLPFNGSNQNARTARTDDFQ